MQRRLDFERQSAPKRPGSARDRGTPASTNGSVNAEGVASSADPPPQAAPIYNRPAVLIALGYYNGRVDGVAGSGTRAAVQRFQASRGSAQNGTITPDLLQEMRRAFSFPGSVASRLEIHGFGQELKRDELYSRNRDRTTTPRGLAPGQWGWFLALGLLLLWAATSYSSCDHYLDGGEPGAWHNACRRRPYQDRRSVQGKESGRFLSQLMLGVVEGSSAS